MGKMRKMNKNIALALTWAVLGTACADDDDAMAPGQNSRVEVISDPAGAAIEINGQPTGQFTPHTFFDLAGEVDFRVVLHGSEGVDYGFFAEDVKVQGDSLHRVIGPLLTSRCVNTTCLLSRARTRDIGGMRLSTQVTGPLFMKAGQGEGLLWPHGSSNSYVSTALPLIAMVSGARDTLALGIYDWRYLAGRPSPELIRVNDRTTLRQSFWIVPEAILSVQTVRGIEVREELVGIDDSNVIFIKLTYLNITNRESYRAIDPLVPSSGMRFDNVYMGFAVDPDIGNSEDDMLTYEPALDMVYTYDSNFQEDVFNFANAATPGLVGLKLVSKPAGTTAVLNGWVSNANSNTAGDWIAGTTSERLGHGVLSGLRSYLPDYAGQQIGFTPQSPSDYRMSVSAGPVTLEPGDSAAITVAVIMAAPVAGRFNSGQVVAPGDPLDTERPIRLIAATLLERARNLVAP